MNFYYDTILGLQYTSMGIFLEVDISSIPSEIDINTFIEKWKLFNYKFGINIGNAISYCEITNNKI